MTDKSLDSTLNLVSTSANACHAGDTSSANSATRKEWAFSTLVEALQHRARTQPDKVIYTFLEDGEIESGHLTFGQLDREARAIAAALQAHGKRGDRAVLIYMPGLEYISAFFGCLYAGVYAVPVYPPDPTRLKYTLPKLKGIVGDAGAHFALTTGNLAEMGKSLLGKDPAFHDVAWIGTDTLSPAMADAYVQENIDSDDIAFLQYTSGSTSAPKGVMVTHGNLVYNLEDIYHFSKHNEHSIIVTWLPTFHDMGLIFGLLSSVYLSVPCFLMSPLAFLQRPYRWLKAIAKYRGSHTAAPNFAYDLCVRKTTPEQRASLDLSSWVANCNGAEPIRWETLERFCEAFSVSKFTPKAICPGYGLAEATLKVSAVRREELPTFKIVSGAQLDKGRVVEVPKDNPDARTLVGCGSTSLQTRVLIVDPDTGRLKSDNEVGEIWVSGPTIAKGYWNRPDESEKTFGACLADTGEGPFLRTGDLGFVCENQVYVTGRIKDLIIVDGQNRYPQDIEWSVQDAHPAIRPGCTAAFSVDMDGTERLIVVTEVDKQFHPKLNGETNDLTVDVAELQQAIRRAVSEAHDLRIHAIALIKAGTIPKTSSGKLQRHACRNAWVSGTLDTWGA